MFSTFLHGDNINLGPCGGLVQGHEAGVSPAGAEPEATRRQSGIKVDRSF